MKPNPSLIRIALLILPLALIAASAGVFWQGEGEPFPFTTLRGETVMIRGHGLYFYDTVNSSSQMIGQDIITLLVGLPLLATALVLTRRGGMRAYLLLTGAFGYFLYTYASMSFLTAFNPLYLVYVALFSLSLFGFILSVAGLNPALVASHITARFPRRIIAGYFLVVAGFLALAWLGLVGPASLAGTPPAGLESAITMVIQSLDLGVIVPTSLITALLLLRKQPWGYTLAVVVLMKILMMGAALISMIILQISAGVVVDPVVTAAFAVISLSGILLSVLTLGTLRD